MSAGVPEGALWEVSCCLLCTVGSQLLAKKVYTLYSLAVQQLSRQDHYDFGLRALTSLLRYAGKKRRLQPDLSDEEVGQTNGPRVFASFVTGLMMSSGTISRSSYSMHTSTPALFRLWPRAHVIVPGVAEDRLWRIHCP